VVFPVFTGVSVIGPVPLAETPVNVPLTEDVQVIVVPPIVEVGRKFNAVPLHTDCIRLAAELVMTGTGVTVTVTSNGVPGQPLADGVIRYTTVPGFIASLL
jgi:hypothetical protein